MASGNQNPFNWSFFSFLQRQESWQEVNGYTVGNIHSLDTPVLVQSDSTVVGNIIAPKVIISGLLCGSLVTEEAVITANGQIWGDLFSVGIEIEPGAKIHGWLSSIEPEMAATLIGDGRVPDAAQNGDHDPQVTSLLDEEQFQSRSEPEINAYHLLQSEIANALAARAEIENEFESRIKEMAGGASEKIESLTTQLSRLQSENQSTLEKSEFLEFTLTQKEAQLEQHIDELSLTRKQISQLQEANTKLNAEYAELSEKRIHLEEEKKRLEQELSAAALEMDKQKNRILSVEEAMKGSLQHSSELQESLERWQELAEIKEKKAEDLETELNNLKIQLTTSEKRIESLQEQKQEAEERWQLTQTSLDKLRHSSGEVANEAAAEVYIEEASHTMLQLEEALLEIEEDRSAQHAWYQLNLKNRITQIELLQNQVEVQAKEVIQLEGLLAQQAKAHQDEQQAFKEEIDTLKSRLHKMKGQLEASDADLNYHLDAIKKQGQHLAEIQARLAERELQLKQAGKLLKKQKAAFKAFQHKAADHIKRLQAKLNANNPV